MTSSRYRRRLRQKRTPRRSQRRFLERRLAACVQILGPIESHYWWKGKIEQSPEWLCLIKTIRGKYPAVEATIRANHSYEVPEIVACPIELGSEPYLEWLRSETAG